MSERRLQPREYMPPEPQWYQFFDLLTRIPQQLDVVITQLNEVIKQLAMLSGYRPEKLIQPIQFIPPREYREVEFPEKIELVMPPVVYTSPPPATLVDTYDKEIKAGEDWKIPDRELEETDFITVYVKSGEALLNKRDTRNSTGNHVMPEGTYHVLYIDKDVEWHIGSKTGCTINISFWRYKRVIQL